MKKFFMMAVMTVLTMTASAQVEKGMRYGLTHIAAAFGEKLKDS